MSNLRLAVFASHLMLYSPLLLANANVGEQAPRIPAANWLNTKGRISRAELEGKIIVAEFWATWCAPCVHNIPHLNKLNKEWKPRGVFIVGITDESKQLITKFMKSTTIEYPLATGSDFETFDVESLPYAVVIDPEGIVAWRGNPLQGALDRAIEETFKETPPTSVNARKLRKLKRSLATAEKQIERQQYGQALAVCEEIIELLPNTHALYANAELMRKQMVDTGDEQVAQAQSLIESRQYVEAARQLNRIRQTFRDTNIAEQAIAVVDNLRADPEIAAVLDAAQAEEASQAKEKKASQALYAAEQLLAKEAYGAAYKRLTAITKSYPESEAGKKAAKKAEQLIADPDIALIISDDKARQNCRGWLKMAGNFRNANRPDKAREYYERIIETYPESSFAAKAHRELTTLK